MVQLSGWGCVSPLESTVSIPISRATAKDWLSGLHHRPFIPRGLGRSYGDSALAKNVMLCTSLNLFLEFHEETGVLRCGGGTSLAAILDVFVSKGWFLPVTPGTKFVTVGGAIASDVHGKNHHIDGCFSQHIISFDLMIASGEILTCSPTQNANLFYATCGGMGLTGLILEATLKLKQISSPYIEQTTFKTKSFEETLVLFDQHKNAPYSIAWIDCLTKGNTLGRSLVMTGRHHQIGELVTKKPFSFSVPFHSPSFLLNRFSIGAFNSIYYHIAGRKKHAHLVNYESFFYPLDFLGNWNRLYGKKGFIQYQCVIPKVAGETGLKVILKTIAEAGRGSFLATLKSLGPQNANLLSFPLEGYTLAVDFKMDNSLFEFLSKLDRLVLDYGGRLYLTKDARVSADIFKRSYPQWKVFQAIRHQYGASGIFSSRQSERLGLF